ncbi:MAG: 3-deoxy-D-manno-octulosonic-acid transferase [Polaribacter sp.]|jgi:3-deoxy-D-manno-octulosonic-acid transferase
MLLLYKFAIRCYYIVIKIASLFNGKARLWIEGRKYNFLQLEKALSGKQQPVIWMHSASLGEFEQGRPVLEELRQKYPNHFLLLTFFSPSGYEIRKNYAAVDHVAYLPLDTATNAKRFLDIVQPELAIFVKYEFWYHFLTALRQRKTPTLLISALFRKEQHFFKPWGGFFRKMLVCFNYIFVQDENSKKLLEGLGLSKITRCGDTRVDRVLQIAKEAKSFPEIEAFVANGKVMVCGSTWSEDEEKIAQWFDKNAADWKLIIAPHDIQERRLREVEERFASQSIRFSQLGNKEDFEDRVLIIDNIGMLSSLYRYAYIAYVGGGFGAGIHSTLEPAAYSIPICFGPKFHKFVEARELVKQGGAFVVDDLEGIVTMLLEKGNYEESSRIVQAFMQRNEGATATVVKYVDSLLQDLSS